MAGIGFRHRADGPWALQDIGFELPEGGRIALVGPLGAGKSTLVALLTGLLTPECGRIRLDGRDIQEIEPDSLRRRFAIAPQHPGLFTGTLRDNLRLGRPEADEAALWRALAMAGLEAFVRSLERGLDTWIGEAGLTLSGGQAKRLSIARALVKDAPILVLDEPGEGLDYSTERALIAAVLAGLGRRSLILITHRTAGLAAMDHILRLPAR